MLERRAPRPQHDPWRHQGLLAEEERADDGTVRPAATIFLTGRECPWRCVMCDLWRYTIEEDTPAGAIPHQIGLAIGELRASAEPFPSLVKLYNAGSFFDPRAVPCADYDAVAARLIPFDRVVVESHPALVGDRVDRFSESLARQRGFAASLEVAMGLETAHPVALERLHKRVTPDQFARAADRLLAGGISLRVFLLAGPPFVPDDEQDEWFLRSMDFAFDCGASVVSLIPTRAGNGALEALAEQGMFRKPRLKDVERLFDAALPRARGRVFVDLWDIDGLAECDSCVKARRDRLQRMNLRQQLLTPVACARCGDGTS